MSKNFKFLALRIILIILLLPTLYFVSFYILIKFYTNLLTNQPKVYLFSVIIPYLLIFIVSYFLGLINISKLKLKIDYFTFFKSILFGLSLVLSIYIERYFFPISKSINASLSWFPYFSALIFAPLVEEFFYKIIILDNLKKIKISNILVILIVTALFTLGHWPNISITLFILGLLTSYLYLKNNNIIQVIVVHFIYNFCNIFIINGVLV